MTGQTLTINTLLIAFSFCMLPSLAMAQDITTEQRNAYEARKEYNKSQSNYQDLLTRISKQEERVAEEQARLTELQSQEIAAKTAVEQSKINLDSKVQRLNEVWDLRAQ